MQNIQSAVKKPQATPKTLTEAIFNALGELQLYDVPTFAFEKHIKDFLSQRFGAMMLLTEKENPEVCAHFEVLWDDITSKGPRR